MDDKNAERIERLRKITGSLTDKELAEAISNESMTVESSRITYWRQKGFHASTANVIDYLLDMIEKGRAPKSTYSVAELSEITGVDEAKIRRLSRDGKLPGAIKRTGAWAYNDASVKHLMQ